MCALAADEKIHLCESVDVFSFFVCDNGRHSAPSLDTKSTEISLEIDNIQLQAVSGATAAAAVHATHTQQTNPPRERKNENTWTRKKTEQNK